MRLLGKATLIGLTLVLAGGCMKRAPQGAMVPGGASGADYAMGAQAPMRSADDAEFEVAYAQESSAVTKQQGPTAEPPSLGTEDYEHIVENDFVAVADDPLSTFSTDVDTASYSNTRRFLTQGRLPPANAVRIEELVNYFEYDYPDPRGGTPFGITTEVGPCPWAPTHRLVHIGLQGKRMLPSRVPPRNLVFLVDVSGSMDSPDKLGLLKHGLGMLAEDVRSQDRVSIVVYAGSSGVVLRPTSSKTKIKNALARLRAGGSTNGASGIKTAYEVARRNFNKDGINRVILATDGDFNVGVSDRGGLTDLIERERESGVFLSVLGFGTGNYKDSTAEALADNGNGNYSYIDSNAEAHKVLVEQSAATLVTIAKDVKIQVEFNPAEVEAYRLVGYENRKLEHEDFNDDTKDAGEIGAGHSVTAIYEVVPAGAGTHGAKVDDLKYQSEGSLSAAAKPGELMTVKLRYKQPDGTKSRRLDVAVEDSDQALADTSVDYRLSAAVAMFGMMLRDSRHKGAASYRGIVDLAGSAQRQRGRQDAERARRDEFNQARRPRAAARPEADPPPRKVGISKGRRPRRGLRRGRIWGGLPRRCRRRDRPRSIVRRETWRCRLRGTGGRRRFADRGKSPTGSKATTALVGSSSPPSFVTVNSTPSVPARQATGGGSARKKDRVAHHPRCAGLTLDGGSISVGGDRGVEEIELAAQGEARRRHPRVRLGHKGVDHTCRAALLIDRQGMHAGANYVERAALQLHRRAAGSGELGPFEVQPAIVAADRRRGRRIDLQPYEVETRPGPRLDRLVGLDRGGTEDRDLGPGVLAQRRGQAVRPCVLELQCVDRVIDLLDGDVEAAKRVGGGAGSRADARRDLVHRLDARARPLAAAGRALLVQNAGATGRVRADRRLARARGVVEALDATPRRGVADRERRVDALAPRGEQVARDARSHLAVRCVGRAFAVVLAQRHTRARRVGGSARQRGAAGRLPRDRNDAVGVVRGLLRGHAAVVGGRARVADLALAAAEARVRAVVGVVLDAARGAEGEERSDARSSHQNRPVIERPIPRRPSEGGHGGASLFGPGGGRDRRRASRRRPEPPACSQRQGPCRPDACCVASSARRRAPGAPAPPARCRSQAR